MMNGSNHRFVSPTQDYQFFFEKVRDSRSGLSDPHVHLIPYCRRITGTSEFHVEFPCNLWQPLIFVVEMTSQSPFPFPLHMAWGWGIWAVHFVCRALDARLHLRKHKGVGTWDLIPVIFFFNAFPGIYVLRICIIQIFCFHWVYKKFKICEDGFKNLNILSFLCF